MGTYLQSVMFPSLERDQVAGARDRVLGALVDGGLIEDRPANPGDDDLSTHDYAAAYPPARSLNGFLHADLRKMNRIELGGQPAAGVLGIREGFCLNTLAFNGLAEYGIATCPDCRADIEYQDADDLACKAATVFWETGAIPAAECPRCKGHGDIRRWEFNEPLGFTYLAFEFWNWPDFRHPANWTIDIPAIMSRAAGGIPVGIGGGKL